MHTSPAATYTQRKIHKLRMEDQIKFLYMNKGKIHTQREVLYQNFAFFCLFFQLLNLSTEICQKVILVEPPIFSFPMRFLI